jgi:acyl carrier protein
VDEIEFRIRQHIIQEYLPKQNESTLTMDDALIQSGIIDSLGVQTLVSFLEKEYHISIPGEELYPENFDSIKAISALIKKLKNMA